MKLLDMIRNGIATAVATANPANSAKETGTASVPLAGLAALALAEAAAPEYDPVAAIPAAARHDETDGSDAPELAARRERTAMVVSQLDANPALQRTMGTHCGVKGDAVIVTLAIRGAGVCELAIPKNRYDPFRMLEILQSSGTESG